MPRTAYVVNKLVVNVPTSTLFPPLSQSPATVLREAEEIGRLCQLNLLFDIGLMFVLTTTSLKKVMGSNPVLDTKKDVSIPSNVFVLLQHVGELG